MLSKLKSGLSKDEQEELESSYRLAVVYRERVKELLTKEMDEVFEKMTKTDPSSCQDYALTMARYSAEVEAIRKKLKFF